MKPKIVTNKRRVWVGTVCIALLQTTAIPAWAQVNDECSVTVNGQTVAVRADGSFRVTNIPAREELVRVYTTCQIEGITLYGVSEFFQVVDLQTYDVQNIAQSPTPLPTTVSLTAAPDDPTLTAVGETTQINVTGLLADETVVDVTPRANGTTYTSSNNAVVTVDQEGIVEAVGRGIAFVTATNEGATAVAQVLVTLITPTSVEGFVHFENGTPVADAVVTLFVGPEGLDFSGMTGPDGSFLFDGVPADFGAITVDVVKTIEMVDFFAEAVGLTPVPEGVTDAGILTLGSGVRWIAATDGFWDEGENWSTGSPPGPRETAIIDLPGVDIVVTHRCCDTGDVGSIDSAETIRFASGTLSPMGASMATDLWFDGGDLDVRGEFKVSNLLTISSGSLRGTGETIVTGTLNWTGGSILDAGTTTIAVGGVLAMSGTRSKVLRFGRTLDIAGDAVWTGTGDFIINSGSTINVLAGSTFDALNDEPIRRSSGLTGSFNNAGTFVKSVGVGTTEFVGVSFNNTGTVDVQTGTLRIGGGGTNTALFSVAEGATAEWFTSASYTLDTGSTMAGLGSFLLSGRLSVADMASVTAENLDIASGGELRGTGEMIVTGTLNWTDGKMIDAGSTTIPVGGVLAMSGSSSKELESSRTLDIAGDAVWTGTGDICIDGGSSINVLAGSTFDAQNDEEIRSFSGLPGSFNNAGTFVKSVGVGTTEFGGVVSFNNTGTVDVQTGTLQIRGGGTNTASFSVAEGATAEFAGNSYTLDTGSTMAGLGIVRLSRTLSVADMASVTAENLEIVSGGELRGTGEMRVIGTLNWTGGEMYDAGTTTIAVGGVLAISGTGVKRLRFGRTLDIAGDAVWTGTGYVSINEGSTINLLAGSTFDALNDEPIRRDFGNTGSFNNAGTFVKSVGVGTTEFGFGVPLNNTGTVDVQTGTLRIRAGGTNTALFSVADGATAEFASPYTLDTGSTMAGLGIVRVSDTLLVADLVSVTAENLDVVFGGELSGTGEMRVTGTLNWTDGQMIDAGTTTIAVGGVLAMSGTGTKLLRFGRTLDIAGGAVWTGTGGVLINEGSTINVLAGGTFDAQNDAMIFWFSDATGSFNNAGTFIKSVGVVTTEFGNGVPFNNTGTVDVQTGTLQFAGGFLQTAGDTLLNGGDLVSTTTLNIQAGSLSGDGIVFANVANDGDALPGGSVGVLDISGDYTQGATGTLNIEIGGLTVGTEYDQLTVSNNVNLAGTLNISIINGFTPMLGDTFEILTFGFRDGVNDDFTTVNGLDAGVGLVFQLNYSLTELTLEVVGE